MNGGIRMSKTKIPWCSDVWNPFHGCSPISEGCASCYARAFSRRLRGRHGYNKDEPFRVTEQENKLGEPARWKKQKLIFLGSMGDVFHNELSHEYRERIFDVIHENDHHYYVILTKRAKNAAQFFQRYSKWGEGWDHVIVGVSAESQYWLDTRASVLVDDIPAKMKMVSAEPLLGKLDMESYLSGLSWVVVGGERGPRPMNPDWPRMIIAQCYRHKVPSFFKSWGRWIPDGQLPLSLRRGKRIEAYGYYFRFVRKNKYHSMLDGMKFEEYPAGMMKETT